MVLVEKELLEKKYNNDYHEFYKQEYPLSYEIWDQKYRFKDETIINTWKRVAKAISQVEQSDENKKIYEKKFYELLEGFKYLPGGRILSNAGTSRKNTTLINCYVENPEDDINKEELESDFKTYCNSILVTLGIHKTKKIYFEELFWYVLKINSQYFNKQIVKKYLSLLDENVLASIYLFVKHKINIEHSGENKNEMVEFLLRHKTIVEFKKHYLNYEIDSMIGIMNKATNWALTLRTGGGVGGSFSNIRPNGSYVNGVDSDSSGPLMFMRVYDQICKSIKSAGARRGAMMAVFNINHPDVIDFISAKKDSWDIEKLKIHIKNMNISDEEKKLYENLVDNAKSFTQFNISVGITDKFMKAVENDEEWNFQWDGKNIGKPIKAKEIWNKIITNTYNCSEPGILFIDRINELNNLFFCENIESTNPCLAGDTTVNIMNEEKDEYYTVSIKELSRKWKDFSFFIKSFNIELGIIEYKKARAFKTKENAEIYKLTSSGGKVLNLTIDHKIYTNHGYLSVNEIIERLTNSKEYNPDKINDDVKIYCLDEFESIVEIAKNGFEDVYDIEVEDNHNFFANNILVHNCGEQLLSNGSVCCLGSFNLTEYILNEPFTKDCKFDFENFRKDIQIAVRFQDNVLDCSHYPLKHQVENAVNKRRIGIGITGLGDIFCFLGMKYGSIESVKLTDEISQTLQFECYKSSALLAKEKGIFPWYRKELYNENHYVKQLPNEIKELINKYGMRNSHVNSIQPTGTSSFIAKNISSSLEPIFMNEYDRYVKTGVTDSKNGVEERKLVSCQDYAYHIYKKLHPKKEIPDYFVTTENLQVEDHLSIECAIAKYIDSAISKTINIPSNYDFEKFKNVYKYAYDSNVIKGVTTYRDGSMSGVLIKTNKDIENLDDEILENVSKRPKILTGTTKKIKEGNSNYYITINLLNNKPYELICTTNGRIPTSITEEIYYALAGLAKKKKIKESYLKEQLEKGTNNVDKVTRLISLALRHGISLQSIMFELDNITTPINSVAYWIKKTLGQHIQDGTIVNGGKKCDNCKSTDLIFNSGCVMCKQCNWSAC